jgi:heptosyltransferase-3
MNRLAVADNPRILIVVLRRLGDVLLATPLIRSVRRAWPQATIDLLVFSGTAGIVEGNPDINRVVTMPARPSKGETLALIGGLFKRYDLAISTQPGDRPTLFTWLAGRAHAGLIDGDGTPLSRFIKRSLLGRSTPAVASIHRVEQMLRLADALGIERTAEVVCPAVTPLGFSPGDNYAVIHPAPMFRYKEWTIDGWRALAAGLKRRGLAVIAIGGPGAAERQYLDGVSQGQIAIHQLSWPQNVALLQKARLFVGPDTSTTHLAAATGCPTVALFGPTDPRLWGPWPAAGLDTPWQASAPIQCRGNVWVVQNPLPCLPCQLEGCERNIASVSACLVEMNAEKVLVAVDQALQARR